MRIGVHKPPIISKGAKRRATVGLLVPTSVSIGFEQIILVLGLSVCLVAYSHMRVQEKSEVAKNCQCGQQALFF